MTHCASNAMTKVKLDFTFSVEDVVQRSAGERRMDNSPSAHRAEALSDALSNVCLSVCRVHQALLENREEA